MSQGMQRFIEAELLEVDPRGDHRPPVSRWRAWWPALLVLAVCLLFSLAHAAIILYRTSNHPPESLAAGQAWTDEDGVNFQLQSLRHTDTLPGFGDEIERAGVDLQWVVARISVQGASDDTICSDFELFGREGLWWRTSTVTSRDFPSYCEGSAPNQTVELVYRVPTAEVDGLRGIAAGHPMMLRQPPLLKPAE